MGWVRVSATQDQGDPFSIAGLVRTAEQADEGGDAAGLDSLAVLVP